MCQESLKDMLPASTDKSYTLCSKHDCNSDFQVALRVSSYAIPGSICVVCCNLCRNAVICTLYSLFYKETG